MNKELNEALERLNKAGFITEAASSPLMDIMIFMHDIEGKEKLTKEEKAELEKYYDYMFEHDDEFDDDAWELYNAVSDAYDRFVLNDKSSRTSSFTGIRDASEDPNYGRRFKKM